MNAGKGSVPRPRQVDYEIYADNYRRTFQDKIGKCPVCNMQLDTIMEEPCDRPDCPYRGSPNDYEGD